MMIPNTSTRVLGKNVVQVVSRRSTKRYATKMPSDAWRKLDNDFFQHLGLGWCCNNASLAAGGRGANKLWRYEESNRAVLWSKASWGQSWRRAEDACGATSALGTGCLLS